MSETASTTKEHFRINWMFYSAILLLIILSGSLWLSNGIALKKQAKALEIERIAIIEKTNEAINVNTKKQLGLMMHTFAWAVRGEATRNNFEQVDQYFQQLVKSENVEEINLVNSIGKILISTNKKNEGSSLDAPYASEVLGYDELSVSEWEGKQIVAAPVMGLDKKIGTLIVVYVPDTNELISLAK